MNPPQGGFFVLFDSNFKRVLWVLGRKTCLSSYCFRWWFDAEYGRARRGEKHPEPNPLSAARFAFAPH